MIARGMLAWAVALFGIVAVARPAAAGPDARRKIAPDQVTRAAGEAFSDAMAADQKGDLQTALGLYRKAFEIAPHPDTIYNIADIERRLGKLTAAIHSYETYLALAPRATDRKEVEALVTRIASTPGKLIVMSFDASNPRAIDLKRAYILVDGELLAKPGTAPAQEPGQARPTIALDVRGGRHVVDVVTSISYGTQTCEVRPGERTECTVHAPPRADGFVVASGSDTYLDLLLERKGKSKTHSRFELPAGRTRLMVRDRAFECPALSLDVARPGEVVTYVFAATNEYDRIDRCRTLTFKQHRLQF